MISPLGCGGKPVKFHTTLAVTSPTGASSIAAELDAPEKQPGPGDAFSRIYGYCRMELWYPKESRGKGTEESKV